MAKKKEKSIPAGLRVVTEGEYKSGVRDGELYVSIEGDNPEEVLSLEARKLAQNSQSDYGFSAAGLELYQRPVRVQAPDAITGKLARYVSTFKFAARMGL